MNQGAYEHEEEVLLYDGADFDVLSVQDLEYKQYKVKEEINYKNIGFTLKKDTLVQLINETPSKSGKVLIKIIEGPGSDRYLRVNPKRIEFHSTVKNLDSRKKPIITINLKRSYADCD